jgi:hypothetical protein
VGLSFVEKKNPNNSGQDAKIFGLLALQVQQFLDQGLLIKDQLFSLNQRSGVGFCREKNSMVTWFGQYQRSERSQVLKCFTSVKHQLY